MENLRPIIRGRFYFNNKNDKTYVLFLADLDGIDGHEERDDEHHAHGGRPLLVGKVTVLYRPGKSPKMGI